MGERINGAYIHFIFKLNITVLIMSSRVEIKQIRKGQLFVLYGLGLNYFENISNSDYHCD